MKQESVLSKINNPEAIRELKPEDLLLLAGALRQEIIDVIASRNSLKIHNQNVQYGTKIVNQTLNNTKFKWNKLQNTHADSDKQYNQL